MFTSLSSTQTAALTSQDCPHCHAHGKMSEQWSKSGKTVECGACGKRVNRPRGRSAGKSKPSDGNGNTGAAQQSGQQGQQEQQQGNQQQQSALQDLANRLQQIQDKQAQIEQQQQHGQENMEQAIRDAIEEATAPASVTVTLVEENGIAKQQTVVAPHPLLPEVLRRINAGIRNFMFYGPSGSGKTTLAESVAQALGLPFYLDSWSGGKTEGSVFGRPKLDGGWAPSVTVTAIEQASVLCWDELDRGDPNVTTCVQALLAQGRINNPSRTDKPVIERHKMSILTATQNTTGNGADPMYVGANQQDAALKSRFACGLLFVDYNQALEAQLVPEREYREAFWVVRGLVLEHRLRRIWGTRELVYGAQLLRHGYGIPEVLDALTVGFSQDEKMKVGLAS